MKKLVSLFVCFTLILSMSLGIVSCTTNDGQIPDANAENYEKALVMLANGDYTGAKEKFEKLGDYRDSKEYLAKFYYMPLSFDYELIGKKGKDEVSYNSYNLPKIQSVMRPDAQAIYEYVYDENGNIQKQLVKKNSEEGYEFSSYEYTYNANGQRIKAEFVLHGGATGFHTFTYDENGNLIKQTYEDSHGNAYTYIMSYDDKGYRTRLDTVFLVESEVINISYQFDDNGRVIKEATTYPDDTVEYVDYTYDAKGNKLSEVFTDNEGVQYGRYDYTYDENGNTIKEEYTHANGDKEYVIIEYELMYVPSGITHGTEIFLTEVWGTRL